MSKWYCWECKTEFESDSNNPICPNGHSLGSWTVIITKTLKCGICGAELDASCRERLDEKTPNGSTIRRPENNQAILEHFAVYHPKVLRQAGKEMGIGIKVG